MLSRRNWMMTTAALAGAGQTRAAQTGGRKNVVISSANGLRACARAMQMLKAGRDTLDAVIAGVNIQEEDPEDNSVGYGGLPNEEGVVELDASVMHGPTRRCGAVAGIQRIKTPSKVAKIVMEQTSHVMLVGEGALRFAKAWGFKEEDLLTEKSRLAWISSGTPGASWLRMSAERVKKLSPAIICSKARRSKRGSSLPKKAAGPQTRHRMRSFGGVF